MRPLSVLFLLAFFLAACAEKPRGDIARAKEHFAAERYREAIPFLERDVERHPENYESQAFIAYAYEKLGEQDRAIEAYEKTLVLNPANTMAFLGLARIHAAQGRWGEAWECLVKASGVEANDTILTLYPLFREAYAHGAFTPPPVTPVTGEAGTRRVSVHVSVIPGSIKAREQITLSASASWPCDPLDAAVVQMIAATAKGEMSRCHDRFFARGLPVAIDAVYTLEIGGDGRIIKPTRASSDAADMSACVEGALSHLRFMAPPVSRPDTR